MDLGRIGIWSIGLRFGDPGAIAAAAAEAEELGYGALWIPGGLGGPIFDDCERLLGATRHSVVAPGILNLWMHTPQETCAGHAHVSGAYPDRFLLGIGVSHGPLIDQGGEHRYADSKPLAVTREFLDGLDAGEPPVPVAERVLAAFGPKMLELGRDRTAGVHPFAVPPEHSAIAREIVGPDAIVAPNLYAVLETDPVRARECAREQLVHHVTLPNYQNNWRRLGFTEEDVTAPGSDRLVDAVVAWGDEAAIAARVQAHLDAGASHVCVTMYSPEPGVFPLDGYRRLAAELFG